MGRHRGPRVRVPAWAWVALLVLLLAAAYIWSVEL